MLIQDFLTIIMQAAQVHKFDPKLEGALLSLQAEPFPPLLWEINSGSLIAVFNLKQPDFTVSGTISQWSKFFLSKGEQRLLKVQGAAQSLQLFQSELERLASKYKESLPSFVEAGAFKIQENVEHKLSFQYAQEEKVNTFKKDLIKLAQRVDKLGYLIDSDRAEPRMVQKDSSVQSSQSTKG